MPAVSCVHCGGAIRGARAEIDAPACCCGGCALRARVPVDAQGNFPVNGSLSVALVIGFLFFNQLLAWGMGVLSARQGKISAVSKWFWAEEVLAVAVWLTTLVVLVRWKVFRRREFVVAVITGGSMVFAATQNQPVPAWFVVANAIWLTWGFRGIFRRPVRN